MIIDSILIELLIYFYSFNTFFFVNFDKKKLIISNFHQLNNDNQFNSNWIAIKKYYKHNIIIYYK